MQKIARLIKVIHDVITGKMRITQTILGIEENNVLKWYGHVAHIAGSRWPKRIKHTHTQEGRRRRGRSQAK